MRLATKEDKEQVVHILKEAFRENPTMKFITRKGKGQMRRIGLIAGHAFDYAVRRNGVFLSESGKELVTGLFELAKKLHLDLYAETTLAQNKSVYERYGFQTYRKWHNPKSRLDVWFMRRRLFDERG